MILCRVLLLFLSLEGVSSFASNGRLSKSTILARNAQENDDNTSGPKNNPSSSKGGSNKKGGPSGDNGKKPTGGPSGDGPPRRRSSQEGDPLPFASNLGKEPPKGGPSSNRQTPRNVSPPVPRPGGRGPRPGAPPPPGPGASWDPRSRLEDNVSAVPPGGGVNIGPPSDRGFTRIGVPGESPSQRKRFDFARGVTEDIFQSNRRTDPYDQFKPPRQNNGPFPGSPSQENGAYPRQDMDGRGRPPENQNFNGGNSQDNGYIDNRPGQRNSGLNGINVQDEAAVFDPAEALKGVRIKETNSWSDNISNFNRGDSLRGARIPYNSYDRGFDGSYGPGPYDREPYYDPRQDPRQDFRQDPRQVGYSQRPGEYDSRPGRYNTRHVDDKYASWPAAKGPRTEKTGNVRDNDSQRYNAKDSRTEQAGYARDYDTQRYSAKDPRTEQAGYARDYGTQRYSNGPRQGGYQYDLNYVSQRYQNSPPRDNYYRDMPPPPYGGGMYPPGRRDLYNNYNYPPQRFGYNDRYYGYQDQMGYGGRGPYDGFWRPDTYQSELGMPGSYSSWRAPLSPDDKETRKAPWDWSS